MPTIMSRFCSIIFENGIDIHVVIVLLGDIALIFHAGADDVDEGEDAGLGILGDAVAELGKVAPAGGAGVSDGGPHRRGWTSGLGPDAEVAVTPGIVAKSYEDVDVDINEARSEVEAGDISGLFRCARGYRRLTMAAILQLANANVSLRVHFILGVPMTWPFRRTRSNC